MRTGHRACTRARSAEPARLPLRSCLFVLLSFADNQPDRGTYKVVELEFHLLFCNVGFSVDATIRLPFPDIQVDEFHFVPLSSKLSQRPDSLNRKVWGWCYVAQGLHERDMLQPGRRGLGFAVGQEPLVSLFASQGCEITGTDLDTGRASDAGWVETQQHASNLSMLNQHGLCDPAEFTRRVSFRHVDMNHIPSDLQGYDFVWSACSLEHLGSLSLGEQFIYNSLACLKPGGIAIHTTEFNVSSNDDTIDHRGTVIFRRCDMERIAENLTAQGQTVEPFAFDTGDLPVDQIVDAPPYTKDRHLKLLLHGYTCTSVGLIVRKTSEQIPQAPRHVTPRSLRDAWRPMRAWIKGRVDRLAEAVTPQRGVA